MLSFGHIETVFGPGMSSTFLFSSQDQFLSPWNFQYIWTNLIFHFFPSGFGCVVLGWIFGFAGWWAWFNESMKMDEEEEAEAEFKKKGAKSEFKEDNKLYFMTVDM